MDSQTLIELERLPFRQRMDKHYSFYLQEVDKGYLTNTLPFSVDFSLNANKDLLGLLRTVHRDTLELNEHMLFPLSDILELARRECSGENVELFDCLYDFESYGGLAHTDPAQPTIIGGFETTNYDFELNVFEEKDAVSYKFCYSAGLYKDTTVERWAAYFAEILRQLGAGNTHLRCDSTACIPGSEVETLLHPVIFPIVNSTSRTWRIFWILLASIAEAAPKRRCLFMGSVIY